MDPLLLAAAAAQTAIVLALLFVLPGLAWGPLLAAGSGSPLEVAGRAVGLSLLTTVVACTLLARLGLFTPPVVLGTLVLLVALPVAARGRPVAALARLRRTRLRRPRSRTLRWAAGALLMTGLAIVLVVAPSHARVGPDLLPITSTVWYYANLARAVATTGGIPATLPEWGTDRPFQTDYLPVTAHTAAAVQLLPGDLLVQLEVYRLAVLVAGLVVAALLLRRWFSSWTAGLGAILLLATVRQADKFVSYKPETWAFVMALFTLWVVDRAIVERSRRLAGLAIVAASLVLLAHAEVFLVLLPALLGLGAARTIERRRLRPLGLVLGVTIGAAVCGALANGALTGELRVAGYAVGLARPGGPVTPPARPAETPPGWLPSADPTWDFYRAAVSPPDQWSAPRPTSFFDSRLLARANLQVWPGLDGRQLALLLVLLLLIGLPVLAWPWLDRRRRRLVLTGAIFAVGLLAGSLVLFALSSTYVPERTGPRRLMPYEMLVPVVAATLVLWGVGRILRPGWRALVGRRGEMLASGVTAAILTVAMVAAAPVADGSGDADPGISQVGYDAYTWMDANLPSDARVLVDAYTDGAVAALARRVGLVDGRAVFLEDRALLADATALLLGAREVFAEPDGPGAADYLARERVGYLLAAGPTAASSDLGGYVPFPVALDALRQSGRYTLVRTFGDGRLFLFHVEPGG
jgi:hypothetical protein